MYQDMDNLDMYGPSIYSKEVHSNRFWARLKFMNKVKPESSEEAISSTSFPKKEH